MKNLKDNLSDHLQFLKDSPKELLSKIRNIEECQCEECKKLKGKK